MTGLEEICLVSMWNLSRGYMGCVKNP